MANTKRYLNKAEKEMFFFLAAFKITLAEHIEGLSKYDKQKAGWAKTAKTYTEKILHSYSENLDERQRDKLILEAAKYRAYVSYHADAKASIDKALKLEENIAVNREDFLDIVEQTVYWCVGCKKRGVEAEQCNLRRLFLKYDVEVFDQHAQEGVCPYRNPGAGEMAAG